MKKRRKKPLLRTSTLIVILLIELLVINMIFMFCVVEVYAAQLQQAASGYEPQAPLGAGFAAGAVADDFETMENSGEISAGGEGGNGYEISAETNEEEKNAETNEEKLETVQNQSETTKTEAAAGVAGKRHEVSTEFVLYDIPLSDELQRYTFDISMERGLNYEMVLAIMFKESTFRENAVSRTNDYGIMQINRGNHKWLSESLGITDFLDPKQSINAGTFHLKGIADNGFDIHQILMVYNLGGRGAKDLWNQGITTSAYSRSVVEYMEGLKWKRRNKNVSLDTQDDDSESGGQPGGSDEGLEEYSGLPGDSDEDPDYSELSEASGEDPDYFTE